MNTTSKPAHAVARWVAIAVGAVCSAAGFVAAGGPGVAGAAVGTLLVVAFLSTGIAPIFLARGAELGAGLGMAVLLLTYTLRLALALVAFVLISQADFADARWVGLTIVATALAWTAVHVWSAVQRSKTEPTIVPELSADERGE